MPLGQFPAFMAFSPRAMNDGTHYDSKGGGWPMRECFPSFSVFQRLGVIRARVSGSLLSATPAFRRMTAPPLPAYTPSEAPQEAVRRDHSGLPDLANSSR